MNLALSDALRHSTWATKTLLTRCRSLPAEQLIAAAPGYGSILATFNHFVGADVRWASILTGIPLLSATDGDDLDALEARADQAGDLWEQFVLAAPFDAERILIMDDGTYEVHAGVVLAQALDHGSVHREQICASLTASGVQAPDLQPWAYANATGRGRSRSRS